MTIHRDKLTALLANPKLPPDDRPRVEEALERYEAWITELSQLDATGVDLLTRMVTLLNQYKKFIEFDLIFCSEQDFLYRQKGQLKLDNTILEEFLPRLVDPRLVPGIDRHADLTKGPQKSFAGFSFGFFDAPLTAGGISVKEKDQDFSVGRRIYFKASTTSNYSGDDVFQKTLNVGYLVAEIKTNLDKTMFQEAAATSRELKRNVNGATYLLLAEWLDMPPIDTRQTDIDEVILLRKAKRLNSNVRSEFSKAENRNRLAEGHGEYLDSNPYQLSSFERIVERLKVTFPETVELDENDVLQRGYF